MTGTSRELERHGAAAEQLRATGEAMTGCRARSVARHDADAMASTEAVTTFGHFLHVERQLLALLGQRLPRDERMLVAPWAAVRRELTPTSRRGQDAEGVLRPVSKRSAAEADLVPVGVPPDHLAHPVRPR